MKSEIKIEETTIEETVVDAEVESFRDTSQIDKIANEQFKNQTNDINPTEDSKHSSNDIVLSDEEEVEVVYRRRSNNETENKVVISISGTSHINQDIFTTDTEQTPCTIQTQSRSNSQNADIKYLLQNDDEPAVKKRRIAASEFLEISEPSPSIDAHVIQQIRPDHTNDPFVNGSYVRTRNFTNTS